MELSKNISINEYAIKLVERKQPFYGLIYALSPVKFENLKPYIKTYQKTWFICLSKSSVGRPILYNKKPIDSFCVCINYQGLDNLIIKNQYLLSLISTILERLGWAKRSTQ